MSKSDDFVYLIEQTFIHRERSRVIAKTDTEALERFGAGKSVDKEDLGTVTHPAVIVSSTPRVRGVLGQSGPPSGPSMPGAGSGMTSGEIVDAGEPEDRVETGEGDPTEETDPGSTGNDGETQEERQTEGGEDGGDREGQDPLS